MMTDEQTTQAGPNEPDIEDVAALLDAMGPQADENLIGVLQDVQEHFGYLPATALEEVSRRMRIPLSRIYGVVSFYAQFYTEPRGRHTVLCCRGTACHVNGAGEIIESVKRTLGIDEQESTPDLEFYLETVACLGTCFLAPVMMIDSQYFGQLTPERVGTILNNYGNGE